MSCGTITTNGMVRVLRELLPTLNPQIADLTYEERTFLYDIMPMKTVPYFNGDKFHKQVYYGYQPSLPFQEEWTEVRKSSEGSDHEPAHDACGVKWCTVEDGAEMVGYGLKEKHIRTEDFCLDDWAYAHYGPEFIQGKIQSLAGVVQGQLENFVIEELFRMAQKFVIVSNEGVGFYQDETVNLWPNLGGLQPGRLTIDVFTRLHERMVHNKVPSGTSLGGGKAYFAIANAADIADFLYHDPSLKQDTRYSSMADDRLLRYNITDQFRGLFAFVNYHKIPRAEINAAGDVEYIFPYQTNVKTQLGVRNAQNEKYYNAKYFTILFMGQAPAAIVRPTGKEAMTEAFRPKNLDFNWDIAIDPCSYPKNNVVYFWTHAVMGWEPGNYPHVYIGIFQRRQDAHMADKWEDPVCDLSLANCTDPLPAQDCPCPQVVDTCCGETDSQLTYIFDRAPGLNVGDPASLKLANGSVATGTVAGVSTDGIRVRIEFGAGVTVSQTPGWYVELLCDTPGACAADVVITKDCTPGDGAVDVTTCKLLIANTVGDALTVTHCDGSKTDVVIAAVDTGKLTYTLTAVTGDLEQIVCENGKICKVCVVPTVDNGCPACDNTYEACGGVDVILPC